MRRRILPLLMLWMTVCALVTFVLIQVAEMLVGGVGSMVVPVVVPVAVFFLSKPVALRMFAIENGSQNAPITLPRGDDHPLVRKTREDYLAGRYGPIEFTLRLEMLMDLWAAQNDREDWRPYGPIQLRGDWEFDDQMRLVRVEPPPTREQLTRLGVQLAAQRAHARQQLLARSQYRVTAPDRTTEGWARLAAHIERKEQRWAEQQNSMRQALHSGPRERYALQMAELWDHRRRLAKATFIKLAEAHLERKHWLTGVRVWASWQDAGEGRRRLTVKIVVVEGSTRRRGTAYGFSMSRRQFGDLAETLRLLDDAAGKLRPDPWAGG